MNREIAFPAWWWGPFGGAPEPRPIARYIVDGALGAELAAWLWLAIEAGASTIVCARPSGAGKSTLLTSLLAFLGPARELHFVRGRYDRFDAIAHGEEPRHALLINEISSHLPIYLWGLALVEAHALARRGAQLMATAHADTPEELMYQLSEFQNELSEPDLACWKLVIFLDAWIERRAIVREVRRICTFAIDDGGRLAVQALAERPQRRAPLLLDRDALLELTKRLAPGCPIETEIARRAALLRSAALETP
jgi:hypothetical protein